MSSLTRETNLRFNVAAIQDVYVKKGRMRDNEFDDAFADALRVRALQIAGLEWTLVDHMVSVFRFIALGDHFEALAAGLGRPYRGIQALYEEMIDLGLFPSSILNEARFHRVPTKRLRLGELLLELGLITEVEQQRAIGVKQIVKEATDIDLAIGQIFRCMANLSIVQFFQALSIQTGVPYKSLDESAPAIFAAAMHR